MFESNQMMVFKMMWRWSTKHADMENTKRPTSNTRNANSLTLAKIGTMTTAQTAATMTIHLGVTMIVHPATTTTIQATALSHLATKTASKEPTTSLP
jgi:hypothetical protein